MWTAIWDLQPLYREAVCSHKIEQYMCQPEKYASQIVSLRRILAWAVGRCPIWARTNRTNPASHPEREILVGLIFTLWSFKVPDCKELNKSSMRDLSGVYLSLIIFLWDFKGCVSPAGKSLICYGFKLFILLLLDI